MQPEQIRSVVLKQEKNKLLKIKIPKSEVIFPMYPLYFILVMLAPAGMLAVGTMWRLSPPQYGKKGISYNTELTRSDPNAWELAHRHCARLWIRIGAFSGIASAGAMVAFSESIDTFWVWLIVGQMVLFCLSVLLVDLLLKTNEFKDNKK